MSPRVLSGIGAYYNENDPYAAAWLRNLISQNLIPPGDVDERSIADVQPDDLAGYRQCHFFAGIGGWGLAARLAGWPDDRELWTGSAPCQPFSVAGQGKAQADDRHLWPHLARLIRARRPAAFMGEQVAAAVGKDWFDGVLADLEGGGTPAGASLSRLVPSTGRIVEIVSGSSLELMPDSPETMTNAFRSTELALWVTASARDWKDTPGMTAQRSDGRTRIDQLPRQVAAALWPTSVASDEKWRYSQRDPAIRRVESGKQVSLECAAHAVEIAPWPTPTAAMADKSIRSPEGARTEVERGKSPDLNAQVTALWATPTAHERSHTPRKVHHGEQFANQVFAIAGMWPTPTMTDGSRGSGTIRPQDTGVPLPQRVAQAVAAQWPTPTTPSGGQTWPEGTTMAGRRPDGTKATVTLGNVVEAHGADTPGSSDTTARPGALNPQFAFWLMGFPAAWLWCAPTNKPDKKLPTGTSAPARSRRRVTPSSPS